MTGTRASIRTQLRIAENAIEAMAFVFRGQQRVPTFRTDTERSDDAQFTDALERARTALQTAAERLEQTA